MRLDGTYQLEFRPSERRRRQCWMSAAINIAPLQGGENTKKTWRLARSFRDHTEA